MPYTQIDELPDGVKNNLPTGAQRIYLSAFNSAYEGTCKDDSDKDECASKIAWSAVKNSYKKQDGKWMKKKSDIVQEFSFYITKAAFDKSSGEMRWAATASDTSPDLTEERMSLELFNSFLGKIDKNVQIPEKYASKAWSGGMPYISVAHYDALDGKGIAGDTSAVYVDGDLLKAKGTFRDTELGRSCFRSVCKSIADKEESPVRISIAFLDLAHKHGDIVFERTKDNKICSLCLRGIGDKVYVDGQLIHLALTRIPANTRTDIIPDEEVLRSESMTTRKQDAESIIGEELAEELEQESTLVGKSQTTEEDEALVIKSEDDETPEESEQEIEEVPEEVVEEETEEVVEESQVEKMFDSEPLGGATSFSEARAYMEQQDKASKFFSDLMIFDQCTMNILEKEGDIMDLKRQFTELVLEFSGELSKKSIAAIERADRLLHEEKSELDQVYDQIKSVLLEVKDSDLSEEEKLFALQEPLNVMGELLKSEATQTPVQEEGSVVKSVEKIIGKALQPLVEQMSLLNARVDEVEKKKPELSNTPPVREPVIPAQRSIAPALIAASQSLVPSNKPLSFKEIARKSVGLEK